LVRKRSVRRRTRARRPRKKTIAPTTGWLLAEVSHLTGLPLRRIRYYVTAGVLTAPEFHGRATRYQRSHVLRLLGLGMLKARGMKSIKLITQGLNELGDEGLEKMLRRHLAAHTAAALGIEVLAPAVSPTPAAGAVATVSQGSASPRESWQRVHLFPGVELMVRDDASVSAQRSVQEIIARYTGQQPVAKDAVRLSPQDTLAAPNLVPLQFRYELSVRDTWCSRTTTRHNDCGLRLRRDRMLR
jgi:DNA-binding transcriptional MerR regulator